LALSNTKSTGQEGSKADDFQEKVPQGIKGVTKAPRLTNQAIHALSLGNSLFVDNGMILIWLTSPFGRITPLSDD